MKIEVLSAIDDFFCSGGWTHCNAGFLLLLVKRMGYKNKLTILYPSKTKNFTSVCTTRYWYHIGTKKMSVHRYGPVVYSCVLVIDQLQGSTSDSIVKFQLPSWAYLSTIFFGIIFVFYADNIAEERLIVNKITILFLIT
ncbi:hypothetical protein GW17_00028961 [Ensete ventricosum]|nr:hypothetical protein GW17_00028961 [Ensete ventricosum]